MEIEFKSKVDIWLPLLISILILPLLFLLYKNKDFIFILLLMAYGGIMIYIYSFKYIICGDKLKVYNSFILLNTYDLNDVVLLKKTHSIISSPASSLDRLQLIFINGKNLIISPVDKKKFIEQVLLVNPRVNLIYKS